MKPLITILLFGLVASLSAQVSESSSDTIDEKMPALECCESEIDERAIQQCTNERMNSYLKEKLVVRVKPKGKDKKKMAVVHFTVDKDGLINEVKIKKSISPELDILITEAVFSMNDSLPWNPGIVDGKEVSVEYWLALKLLDLYKPKIIR